MQLVGALLEQDALRLQNQRDVDRVRSFSELVAALVSAAQVLVRLVNLFEFLSSICFGFEKNEAINELIKKQNYHQLKINDLKKKRTWILIRMVLLGQLEVGLSNLVLFDRIAGLESEYLVRVL